MREAPHQARHQFGEFLEFAPAPALRHAAEACHALRHIGLEADALLLAVIADIDAGRGLLFHHVAHRFVHFGGHFGGIEFFARFLAQQEVGQFLVARQAADMGSQNTVAAEQHALLAPMAQNIDFCHSRPWAYHGCKARRRGGGLRRMIRAFRG